MDYFKDFTYSLRKHAYTSEANIYLRRVAPKLLQIVSLLSDVKFEDGSYHTYYGEVKTIMSGFLTFYYEAIDDIIQDVDRLENLATRADLIELMDKTIEIHKNNQEDFKKDYIPENPTEEKNFQEIRELYGEFMKKVYELQKIVLNTYTPAQARKFAKKHFQKSLQVANGLCEFAYTYLSVMLANDLDKTRASLLEIHNRINNNLKSTKERQEGEIQMLHELLFEKNKESLNASRTNRESLELAETEHAVEKMQKKIENKVNDSDYSLILSRLEDEVAFWEQKLNDFNKVAANLNMIRKEIEKIELEEKKIRIERPDAKRIWVEKIKDNYAKQKVYLQEKWKTEARTLLTFYACRGIDRIFYMDNIGKYYLDEYNHQVYVMDHGLADYHLSCLSKFIKPPEKKYYFDKYGRYVYEAGNKMYQLAPCGSVYKLGQDEVLHKPKDAKEAGLTEEEFISMQLRRKIKDPNDVTIVPDREPMDIRGTLNKDNATYLWDTFGSILPHALHDVALAKSKNPIHYLAHRLLYHRYGVSKKVLLDRKISADAFKADIYKEREENLLAASKAWKSKQVKRRKPEESDDAQERAVYDAHIAREEFIKSLDHFNI